ncbi:hypothetical protein FACS1894181_09450 [Bacteroidia bacterium]|nr:hypothetical protein FACS1894181_09450 [Bacteroidia bacterium]
MLSNSKEKYRALCREEPSLPVFSRDWWLDAVCGESKWDVLLEEEKGCIRATFPLYKPLPHLVTMPPCTQTMGPWFAPGAADTKYTTDLGKKQTICKAFIHELAPNSSFLQNFNYQITDWLPFYWAGFTQTTRYTYLLENINNPSLLWSRMSANIRRNITKAKEKRQITVRRGIPTGELARILALTFGRQQLKAGHIPVLERLVAEARKRGQGDIWGGYDANGALHAAVFTVWQESSAYYIAGGGDPALRDSGAHSLVMWEAILGASEHTSLFDFEGSMLPGVERFFREFGATQTPYFSIAKGKPGLLDRVRMKLLSGES